MFIGISEMFKIGIGPSSSHTMGPMVAASRFLQNIQQAKLQDRLHHITASLHGSLAFTGKGHASDRAVWLGLHGLVPETVDLDKADALIATLFETKTITTSDGLHFAFDPQTDLIFDYDRPLPAHANGMQFSAFDAAGQPLLEEIYYSIGGGFVCRADEMGAPSHHALNHHKHQFHNAEEMLAVGQKTGLSIAQMQWENECAYQSEDDAAQALASIRQAMMQCLERGLATDGILPGGLHVKRRAKNIHQQLIAEEHSNHPQPHIANEWLSVYAMAVNEENAAGGRVVTSPTNGAAGIIPAVIRYYHDHCHGAHEAGVDNLLLTAAAIGALIKTNASISGAEVGCQGEVGSASAMAAAGLCAALGGTNAQCENAAEIALEHHLGMTCDPAGGLVQVPCIERNGMGAIKAVSAASLALRGDGTHFIPLDNCIETMRQTGLDMHERYKETSLGGLAVNLPSC